MSRKNGRIPQDRRGSGRGTAASTRNRRDRSYPTASPPRRKKRSNGVFTLCPDKSAVPAEAFRVLRPGGRIQMADILLEEGVTPEDVAQKGSWSD